MRRGWLRAVSGLSRGFVSRREMLGGGEWLVKHDPARPRRGLVIWGRVRADWGGLGGESHALSLAAMIEDDRPIAE